MSTLIEMIDSLIVLVPLVPSHQLEVLGSFLEYATLFSHVPCVLSSPATNNPCLILGLPQVLVTSRYLRIFIFYASLQ